MKRQEEGDSNSSNPESQDSDDSLENSDNEAEDPEDSRLDRGRLARISGLGTLSGIGAISGLGNLGGLHIKVEHYGENEELHSQLQNSSSSEEEGCEDGDDLEEAEQGGMQECDNTLQKRRKRRKSQQQWDTNRNRRMRLSSTTPSPVPMGENATLPDNLVTSASSPTNSTAMTSSVLKIKTEMAEPINFDNDSSIWNFPPNREISRNESPYSMTSNQPPNNANNETFPSPQGQVPIPESVLTPPGNEGAGANVRKPNYNGNSTPSSASSTTGLAPPSSVSSSSADPLSPPLSASPRDKQQGTPTTTSSCSTSTNSTSSTTNSSSSLLYSGDLEALQRLQAGNVVLPLVHRVTASLAPTSTTAPRVYTTGTIRYISTY